MARCLVILVCLLVAVSAQAADPRFFIGVELGPVRVDGGTTAMYPYQLELGGLAGFKISSHWTVNFQFASYTIINDTSLGSTVQHSPEMAMADRSFNITRLGVMFERDLFAPENRLNLSLGLGGGLALWEIVDPSADTLLKTTGVNDQTLDYRASEVMVSLQSAFRWNLSERLAARWNVRFDYLTGVGTDFVDDVMDVRDNTIISSTISLTFRFGGSPEWRSERNWASHQQSYNRQNNSGDVTTPDDADSDGISDSRDKCLNTPQGATVDASGCSTDSDADGIPDGADNCPGTPLGARGMIDINGCPVDSDFDGIPDFLDACPDNIAGANVDATGCPLDGDGDGVPDGLDDCPHTLAGMTVDRHGCIDLSMLSVPMVLNIDYVSGSFEVDPYNRERLKELSRLLVFVTEVKLEINGYTDNIGTATANKTLSQKRANRVRDYLVSLGVDKSRIKAFGKGEVYFVSSNQTAAGRAQNRRVEIVFYR